MIKLDGFPLACAQKTHACQTWGGDMVPRNSRHTFKCKRHGESLYRRLELNSDLCDLFICCLHTITYTVWKSRKRSGCCQPGVFATCSYGRISHLLSSSLQQISHSNKHLVATLSFAPLASSPHFVYIS